jgi:anti-sigma-K factor RskA
VNDTTHRTLLDLLPAYALGALDEEEAGFVEQHLADYPDCVAELTALRDDLVLLAFSAPLATPPPAVKTALFARLDREVDAVVPDATPPTPLPAPRRGRLLDWRGPRVALAALAAVLVIGLLSWAAIAQARLNAERQHLAAVTQQNDQLTAQVSQLAFVDKLLNDPNAAHPVSGPPVAEYGGLPAAGYVYIDPTSTIGLMLTYWLPTIAPDQRFQVWLVTPEGARDSGGLFTADARGNAHVIINAPAPLAKYKSIGVTIEPAGGSPGPTSPRVCGGEIR